MDDFRILGLKSTDESYNVPLSEDDSDSIMFNMPVDRTTNIIKVIGVGGGGSNAVKHMFNLGVTNVNFAVCNTDSQALSKSPIPLKVQLGHEGLGVGGVPEIGRAKAEESLDEIEMMLGKETQMLFITAGMGGGTGTGAAPVIARAARNRGILTIGVVTLPFAFEKRDRCEKALLGVDRLKQEVDSLLVINNQRLLEIYSGDNGISINKAFEKTDNILATATKTIAEIITIEGTVNRDFNDVKTVMENGGSAIVSVGYGEGDNRIMKAMKEALHSPLLSNMDIQASKKLLYIIYSCQDAPVMTHELTQVNEFMDSMNDDLQVLWGLYPDDTIGNQVKVAIVATGFDSRNAAQSDTTSEDEEERKRLEQLRHYYYGHPNSSATENTVSTSAPSVDSPKDNNDTEEEIQMGMHIEQKERFSFKRLLELLEKVLGEE